MIAAICELRLQVRFSFLLLGFAFILVSQCGLTFVVYAMLFYFTCVPAFALILIFSLRVSLAVTQRAKRTTATASGPGLTQTETPHISTCASTSSSQASRMASICSQRETLSTYVLGMRREDERGQRFERGMREIPGMYKNRGRDIGEM